MSALPLQARPGDQVLRGRHVEDCPLAQSQRRQTPSVERLIFKAQPGLIGTIHWADTLAPVINSVKTAAGRFWMRFHAGPVSLTAPLAPKDIDVMLPATGRQRPFRGPLRKSRYG